MTNKYNQQNSIKITKNKIYLKTVRKLKTESDIVHAQYVIISFAFKFKHTRLCNIEADTN